MIDPSITYEGVHFAKNALKLDENKKFLFYVRKGNNLKKKTYPVFTFLKGIFSFNIYHVNFGSKLNFTLWFHSFQFDLAKFIS
jgi:hypothetical protein